MLLCYDNVRQRGSKQKRIRWTLQLIKIPSYGMKLHRSCQWDRKSVWKATLVPALISNVTTTKGGKPYGGAINHSADPNGLVNAEHLSLHDPSQGWRQRTIEKSRGNAIRRMFFRWFFLVQSRSSVKHKSIRQALIKLKDLCVHHSSSFAAGQTRTKSQQSRWGCYNWHFLHSCWRLWAPNYK